MNVKIQIGDSNIKIVYDDFDQLSQILKFEGVRLNSLINRNIQLPEYDVRKWDNKRKITVRTNHFN